MWVRRNRAREYELRLVMTHGSGLVLASGIAIRSIVINMAMATATATAMVVARAGMNGKAGSSTKLKRFGLYIISTAGVMGSEGCSKIVGSYGRTHCT